MSIDITQELHQNFLDYAYETNSERAFPDARDGLKPGQRACLWEMYVKGYKSSKPHVKSAKVSGGVAASWWPHGTTAIYETFGRMSQPWINNICEVDFHGGNGGLTNGSALAADRYTEARLSAAIEESMFQGIKKNVVPMIPNFSEDEEWPSVLPAVFPRLYINGSQGIGVTIANTWLPGNLREITSVIENYVKTNTLNYDNLAPDFPTGGIIINKDELKNIYETGKGKAVLRAKTEVKDNVIIITELPYQTYAEPFVEEIVELIQKDEISGISDAINKTDKKGLRIEIECEKDANPNIVLRDLFRKTNLEKTFNANQYALVGKTPRLLNLKEYLDIYINHNIECITKEYQFDLNEAIKRKEIVEGLLKALIHIDDIIQLIKNSESSNSAKDKLIITYNFTESQAKAIVSMRLGSLARLEGIELEDENKKLSDTINSINKILSTDYELKTIFLNRLNKFTDKYGKPRKTELVQLSKDPKEKIIETVTPEDCVVVITDSNLIKRIPSKSYRAQKRGGVGIKNSDDIVAFTVKTNTIDTLMIFSSEGKMYRLIVDDIPSGTNASKGVPVSSLVKFDSGETPMAYASLYHGSTAKYVFFVTKKGIIKKVPLDEYTQTKRAAGVKAITLKEGDALAAVTFIEEEPILLTTKNGMIIKFETKDLPLSSRIAQGVKGMNVSEDDSILTCLPIKHATDSLAVFSADGYGKKVSLNEFNTQNRGGKGVKYSNSIVAGVALVDNEDNLLVIGNKNSIRISSEELPLLTRTSLGNHIIKNNNIVSVSKI